MRYLRAISGLLAAATFGAGAALADSAPLANPFSRFADANAVVLAVEADFAPAGEAVRLAVYDDPSTFLEMAAVKHSATIDEAGVALVRLHGLKPGDYAFVAYLDKNGDGKLNRSAIGSPKEPYIFSNGVKPKLRKPTFAETKVSVAPGEVVVLTLKG